MNIRWGFLGAGYVASRAMAPAVHCAQRAVLQGVASRNTERSRSLEPVAVFDSYAELVASSDIDAVYISLTNSQHHEWAIAALSQGKHVLCEKPLAMNGDEVDSMRQASEAGGAALVEAVWVRWHPRFQRFTDIVRCGTLGANVHMSSAFTFASEMTGNYRLEPDRGGGALMDVGCYQVHTWLAAFGSDIEVDLADVDRFVGPTGVDLTTRVTAVLSGSQATPSRATMACSFIEESKQSLVARGSETSVEMMEGEAFTSWREPSSLCLGDTIETFADCDAFVLMVEQVSRQFAGEEPPLFSVQESSRCARVMDAIGRHVQT